MIRICTSGNTLNPNKSEKFIYNVWPKRAGPDGIVPLAARSGSILLYTQNPNVNQRCSVIIFCYEPWCKSADRDEAGTLGIVGSGSGFFFVITQNPKSQPEMFVYNVLFQTMN